MLFSVIIPVYNVEKYLSKCVDSILSQSFTDFEVILVNDGSKDKSGEICDEYAKKDCRVKVIHQENAGLAVARNIGTKVAQGEYIVYLDSDDYIGDPLFLEKIAEKTSRDTEVIFYGYKKLFDGKGVFGNDIDNYPNTKGQNPEKVLEELLKTDMYDGSAWSKTIRKDFFERHQISFMPGMISEDSDWFLQVVTCAKTYDNVNQAFVVYRQREGSISHAPKIKSLTDNLSMLERWSKRFQKQDIPNKMKESLMSILARYYANLLVLYTRFPKKDVKVYYARVKALRYLLQYSVTNRAKIVKIFCSIFGLRLSIFLLKVYGKIKGTI